MLGGANVEGRPSVSKEKVGWLVQVACGGRGNPGERWAIPPQRLQAADLVPRTEVSAAELERIPTMSEYSRRATNGAVMTQAQTSHGA